MGSSTRVAPNNTSELGVNKVASSKSDIEEIEYLAKTIYGEARGESRAAKRSVGWVIRNRLSARRWGNSYRAVVTARFQFTCWSPDDPNFAAIRNPTGTPWKEALEIAKEVFYADEKSNPVSGATHYYSPMTQAMLSKRFKHYPLKPGFLAPPSRPVEVIASGVDRNRFRFYRGIAF